MNKIKELYYWLKAQITLDNTYFNDLEDLQHENNELSYIIQSLDEENEKLRQHIRDINNNFDGVVLEDFRSALYNFLELTGQSNTSNMLANELRMNGEVEVQIAGKDVNRKRIKQAFGNFERYMTIDIVERGLYYSLIFKKR